MPEPINECFNCEAYFATSEARSAGVAEGFCTQYCSKECEAAFEAMLAQSATTSEASEELDTTSSKDAVSTLVRAKLGIRLP